MTDDKNVKQTQKEKFTTGQTWGALRKAWKGYRIAKVGGDKEKMKEYATKIRTLQKDLGVPRAKFPALGKEFETE
jgi:hypothetical protein